MTRVVCSAVPAAKRPLKLRLAGVGEPLQVAAESMLVASRPCRAKATVTGLFWIGSVPPRFAWIGVCGVRPSWFTSARRSSITTVTAPLAGKVNWKPLNEMLWFETSPDMPDGTVPVLVSKLSEASVENPPELIRLVTVTGRYTLRYPESVAPGVPVHCRRISPRRSATPSECTTTGTAEAMQAVGA